MKRYFVFAYDKYYPTGGLGDLRGSFIEYADAFKLYSDLKREEYYDYIRLYHFNNEGDFEIVEKYDTDIYA